MLAHPQGFPRGVDKKHLRPGAGSGGIADLVTGQRIFGWVPCCCGIPQYPKGVVEITDERGHVVRGYQLADTRAVLQAPQS